MKDEMISSHDDVREATPAAVPTEVQVVVDALDDKRAVDIAVLDLRSASETLDWFIVASGESNLQLKALEDSVREGMKKAGHYPKAVGALGPHRLRRGRRPRDEPRGSRVLRPRRLVGRRRARSGATELGTAACRRGATGQRSLRRAC